MKHRIEFYKTQLQVVIDSESVSNAAAGTGDQAASSLSTESSQ